MDNDTEQRIKQLSLNADWLRERIDEIHAALCPGQNGTWQQRAEQAVTAAKKHSTFFKDVATLTVNHDVIGNDYAAVYPSNLGKALEKVRVDWYELKR